MIIPRRVIIDNYIRLTNLLEKMIKAGKKDDFDMNIHKSSILPVVYDMLISLREMEIITDSDGEEFKFLKNCSDNILEAFDINDEEIILMKMELYLEMLREVTNISASKNFLNPNMSYYNTSYYTSTVYDYNNRKDFVDMVQFFNPGLKKILNSINFRTREYSLLNIHSASGLELSKSINPLKEKVNLTTYGIENDEKLYFKTKDNFDKSAYGLGKSSFISNSVFDIGYLTSKFDFELISSSFANRTERNHIEDLAKYIRPDGLVMIAIPVFRLYRDLCLQVSKMLKNVSIYTQTEDEFVNDYTSNYRDIRINSDFTDRTEHVRNLMMTEFSKDMILIVGHRKDDIISDKETYTTLRNAVRDFCIDKEKFVNNNTADKIKAEYNLPGKGLIVENFRGSKIDKFELEELLKGTNSLDNMLKEQYKIKTDEDVEPLLPFNLGQIGLVLTSGKLDGKISRDGIDHHVIKGRVVKDIVRKENDLDGYDDEDKEETMEEHVYTNKVEISLFNQDGRLIRLT